MSEYINQMLMAMRRRTDLASELVLQPRKTALIIVDMQYFSACRTTGMGKQFTLDGQADAIAWRFDRIEQKVIPNLQKLLNFFRKNKLKVIYITVYSESGDYTDIVPHVRAVSKAYGGRIGNIESQILKEIEPVKGETVMNKTTVGAFASTALDSHLRRYGIEHLLISGVATQACPGQTARSGADLGYHVVMVEDACSDFRQEDHEWFLSSFERFFGRVENTENVIAEMSRGL